jgi:glycosyltransferase involved in cell wall biosynthesis
LLVKTRRPRLAFVSPVFLFPTDTGGRIRSTNILRGLKGGKFDVTLIGPGAPEQLRDWARDIDTICDRFVPWASPPPRPRWRRAIDLLGSLPINVAADRSRAGRQLVQDTLAAQQFDVAVFDFVHAAVLRPAHVNSATVCFTHNVEAEIFERHAERASGLAMRLLWASQFRKMKQFEEAALPQFSRVVAVSDRDAARFRERYALKEISVIPTGVDLEFFSWAEPPAIDTHCSPTVVFTGSMDWAANVDGIGHFLENIWPTVTRLVPSARLIVVGRSPPPSLIAAGRLLANVQFTGFVDDVRPYVHAAHVFTIPLRVGGGTRIKAFEAMAMGCPVVSTTIGIEGLDVQDRVHFLRRDSAADQANAIVELIGNANLRRDLARRARRNIESRFGHVEVARVFEHACLRAIDDAASAKRLVPMEFGAPTSIEP